MRLDLSPPDWATHLLSDLSDWNRRPLPVAELQPVTLPEDVYFEYAWLDAAGKRRADPLNTQPRLNPWWPYACNLMGPTYAADPTFARATEPARGRTVRLVIESKILGQSRRLLVYSPPGFGEARLPWVLFQDGMAYYRWGRVPQVLDLLVAEGSTGPAHLIFLPPVDRTGEYAFNADFRRFIGDELVPTVARRIPWDGRATAWGASLGGLLSAQLAWARPDVFQQVVGQSGAFQFSPDMDFAWPFGGDAFFLHQVRQHQGPLPAVRWHLECGTLEWLQASNIVLHNTLRQRGAEATLTLRSAGHNWVNWQGGIAAGLRACLENGDSENLKI